MRVANSRSRSSRRFNLTIGEHSAETRYGDSTVIDREAVNTGCSFDIEPEREGGGACAIGATFLLERWSRSTHQSPVNFGARRSMNADTASPRSAEARNAEFQVAT